MKTPVFPEAIHKTFHDRSPVPTHHCSVFSVKQRVHELQTELRSQCTPGIMTQSYLTLKPEIIARMWLRERALCVLHKSVSNTHFDAIELTNVRND